MIIGSSQKTKNKRRRERRERNTQENAVGARAITYMSGSTKVVFGFEVL